MSLLQQILGALVALLVVAAYLFNDRWFKFLRIVSRTFPRDILGAIRFLRINAQLWWWETRGYNVARIFTNLVKKHPDKIAFIFEDKEWTYQELEDYSNKVGRYFRAKPMSRGDTIALIMENRPEYIAIWLGLSKAGFVTALVNTNLRGDVLIHSIKAANCTAVIYSSEAAEAIKEIQPKIKNLPLYEWAEHPDIQILDGATDLARGLKIETDDRSFVHDMSSAFVLDGFPRQKLIYIYTSGTTGMPKAAVISNLRYMLMSCGVYTMLNLKTHDRIYNALPLYHTAGGIVGAGQALIFGVTVVLRRKFSASKFWPDCVHYECTVAQYIGEMCRYLLSVPKNPADTNHKIRLMYGNGLRPQIWKTFVERFKVQQIGEFYGATEGNSNLVNIDNQIGAVGFVPRYAHALYPVALLKVDESTGLPIRGPDGLCTICEPGEPGIFVGKINPKKAVNDFSGYVDKKDSEKKIIHDVFKKGDRVFNSGDLLVMDEYGYFYFKDRTGDTFRWRGENVATSEVEGVISTVVGLKDAVVYGVEVPGNEGKAGMAAIYDPDKTVNLKDLAAGVNKALPPYARPLFVRILADLPITGTFKLKKKDLQDESYDIRKVRDPLYFLDKTGQYVPLTEELYNNLQEEKVRV